MEIDPAQQSRLWVRGGFPRSFLADTEEDSVIWREGFIRTYLERDIPQLGPRIPAETLRRFWTMLAHAQGGLHNAAELARALAVDGKTVARYLDLMVDLLLVRRLPPYFANVGKRLVKSPKVYVRDSGLVHTLLRLDDLDDLLGHPVAGASWEGFVIENLLRAAPERTQASFYRTATGVEVDLVLELPGDHLWVMEVKRGLAPKVEPGLLRALEDLNPDRAFLLYSGAERYPKAGIEAIGVREMAQELAALGGLTYGWAPSGPSAAGAAGVRAAEPKARAASECFGHLQPNAGIGYLALRSFRPAVGSHPGPPQSPHPSLPEAPPCSQSSSPSSWPVSVTTSAAPSWPAPVRWRRRATASSSSTSATPPPSASRPRTRSSATSSTTSPMPPATWTPRGCSPPARR